MCPFTFTIEQLFLNLHVSHEQHDHKVGHKATQNNYVLLFQFFFYYLFRKGPHSSNSVFRSGQALGSILSHGAEW